MRPDDEWQADLPLLRTVIANARILLGSNDSTLEDYAALADSLTGVWVTDGPLLHEWIKGVKQPVVTIGEPIDEPSAWSQECEALGANGELDSSSEHGSDCDYH